MIDQTLHSIIDLRFYFGKFTSSFSIASGLFVKEKLFQNEEFEAT